MNASLRSATLGGALAVAGASCMLVLAGGAANAAPGPGPAIAAPTAPASTATPASPATPASTAAPATTVTPSPGSSVVFSPASTDVPPVPSATGTVIQVPAGRAGTSHPGGAAPAWEVLVLIGGGLSLLGGGVVAIRRR